MPDPEAMHTSVQPTDIFVPTDWVPLEVTTEPVALPKPYRAIRANSAGTITVIMAAGNTRELPFLAGETRQGVFTHIIDLGAVTLAEGAV